MPPITGINLGSSVTFNDCAELAFADLMRAGSPWSGFTSGVGPNGLPLGIAADGSQGAAACSIGYNGGGNLHSGPYRLKFTGDGTVGVSGGPSLPGQTGNWGDTDSTGGTAQADYQFYDVNFSQQFSLRISRSNPSNPVRDISFTIPGHTSGQEFNSEFLANVGNFRVKRFMDWTTTQVDFSREWADRQGRQQDSYAIRGWVPYEACCRLCNLQGSDAWFCIPSIFSLDAVDRMAALVEANLDPDLAIYIEYANEVWDSGKAMWQRMLDEHDNGMDTDPNKPATGAWEYIAYRDGLRTNRFKAAIAAINPSRVVKVVLARQSAYIATLDTAVAQYQLSGFTFDAISSAPYFFSLLPGFTAGVDINDATTLYQSDPAAAITAIMDGLVYGVDYALQQVQDYRARAATLGVPLCFYEVGQSLVNPNNNASTPLLADCNRDPRMYARHRQLIDGIPSDTEGPVCWYNSAGAYGRFGEWGLKEFTSQPDADAPKWLAVTGQALDATPDFSLSTPATVTVPIGSHVDATVTVSPLGGYSAAVTLGTGSLPAGVTAAFTPATVAGSGTSTMRLTASGSATPGSSSRSVTGTDGTLSRQRSFTLVVADAGDPDPDPDPTPTSGGLPLSSIPLFRRRFRA